MFSPGFEVDKKLQINGSIKFRKGTLRSSKMELRPLNRIFADRRELIILFSDEVVLEVVLEGMDGD